MFTTIKKQMQEAFLLMTKGQSALFITDVDKEVLWNTYINSFPKDVQQEYTCNACKSFIRNYANIVTIVDNKLVTMWEFEPKDDDFTDVVKNLHILVKASSIKDVFVSKVSKVGVESNVKLVEGASPVIWNHFALDLRINVVGSSDSIESGHPNRLKGSRNRSSREGVGGWLPLWI